VRVLLLIAIIAVGGALIAFVAAKLLGPGPGRRRRWALAERLDPDGTLRIGVGRGGEFREVRAIPRGDDEIDVLSDIRIAKNDAAELAAELNRRP
jgi:hypothetical protein